MKKLIDIGTRALPANSRFAKIVKDMKELHRKYPNDWKAARAEMTRKYYVEEPADSKTIWNANLNGAAGILALLYGGGDFQKTLDLACVMGFDADNQAATMSGLIGLIVGRKGIPSTLLFPFPELGWKEPLNDLYKNVTRHDMPDASLKDMAMRMAAQGEAIILSHGGKRITENDREYYVIDPDAEFIASLELPVAPLPHIETGDTVSFAFLVSGGKSPYSWSVVSGSFPDGITFRSGKLTGRAGAAGIYTVKLHVASGRTEASREFELLVRPKNLAASAECVLSRVQETDTKKRDALWLTVPRSLHDH